MRNVTDYLKEAGVDFKDELEGKSSAGGFDGPPLDLTREYRVEVDRAEWRKSNAGKWSYSITFQVTEDLKDEFVGRKFSEYYSIDKGAHEAAKRSFAKFLGESGVDLSQITDTDNDAFIQNFVGVSYVIAPRHWGEEMDRTGVRYMNRDRGQALRDGIKPPPAPRDSGKLTADISVNKDKGPFPAETGAEEAPEVASEEPQQAPPQQSAPALPGSGTRPAGVNLPPGLSRD